MTGEHGGCCCSHDHQHHDLDQQLEVVQAPQNLTVIEAAGCCGGAVKDEETSRSHDQARHSTAVRSSS